MITDEIADFISENKISVSTSLDGPKWLYEKNRPMHDIKSSSYDAMLRGIEILSRRGITTGAIQTTTRESLAHAEEIINEYAALGFKSVFLRPLTRLGAAMKLWDYYRLQS